MAKKLEPSNMAELQIVLQGAHDRKRGIPRNAPETEPLPDLHHLKWWQFGWDASDRFLRDQPEFRQIEIEGYA